MLLGKMSTASYTPKRLIESVGFMTLPLTTDHTKKALSRTRGGANRFRLRIHIRKKFRIYITRHCILRSV